MKQYDTERREPGDRIKDRSMKKTQRHMTGLIRLTALWLCALMCLPLTACGGEEETGAKLKEGPRFTVATAQEPDSLNPLTSEGGLAGEFFLLCYDTLWRKNEAGENVACLAEDWSLSSDRLTWTIRLRRDATFSDGVPVTSADVLFSYELMQHSDTVYSDYFDGVTAIRCPDDYTVVISTDRIKGDMLDNPTPILPAHIWKDYEFDPGSFDNALLIGSGPFVYDPEASGEDGWSFRARADHFEGQPAVGEVFFARHGTVTGAARAVSAGEADASFGLTDVQLTTLESVPGVKLVQAMLPEGECRLLVFNTRSDFFSSESMRQSMEYGLDREWFLAMSAGGTGITGSSFMSPGMDGFVLPDGLRGFAPEYLESALRMAGYVDSDGDGLLESGTGNQELTLTLWTSGEDEWASTAATILTEDLEELGVQVNWRKTDGSVTAVCPEDDSWDMCLYTWHGSLAAAVTARRFLDEIGGLSGWSDPAFESALALLCAAEDADAAAGYARQLQQLVYNACPAAVLSYAADIQAIREDRWTGFESLLAGGGLFHNGSRVIYMSVTPRTETDAAE